MVDSTVILIVGFDILLIWLRVIFELRGSNRPEKLSQDREAALLKAWEDYELGSSRSEKRPPKGPRNAALRPTGSASGSEPGHIIWIVTFLLHGIVAVGLVIWILSSGLEPRPVAATNFAMLTVGYCAVALLIVALALMSPALNRGLASRKPPRVPGEGGGVRDDWLDGPQAAAVKSRPRRSAASG
jgi:hypothetical protein